MLAAQKYSTSAPWTEAAPLHSFVCPVYNTPRKYLDELLDSFGPQKQGAWELILCDDGSTSAETREWLESLDYILQSGGPAKVERLLRELTLHAKQAGVKLPFTANTRFSPTGRTRIGHSPPSVCICGLTRPSTKVAATLP